MSEIRRLCEGVTRLLVAVPVLLVVAHAQAHAAAQPPAEPLEPVTAVPPEPLAAGKVSTVLPDPSPFVHQKALNDFYVTYRLNVVVGDPAVMLTTYSELHAAILDEFNTAGVEIMSPHYRALRDGAEMTVPGAQTGEAQETASFRIQMGGSPSARSAKS